MNQNFKALIEAVQTNTLTIAQQNYLVALLTEEQQTQLYVQRCLGVLVEHDE